MTLHQIGLPSSSALTYICLTDNGIFNFISKLFGLILSLDFKQKVWLFLTTEHQCQKQQFEMHLIDKQVCCLDKPVCIEDVKVTPKH